MHGARAALNAAYYADISDTLAYYSVEEINTKTARLLVNYGIRCFKHNTAMADYIKYVSLLRFDSFGTRTMREHCPAYGT